MPPLLALSLLACLCQAVTADGTFSIKLIKYSNPNSVLSSGEKCDIIGGFSPCDMKFTISYRIGTVFSNPAYTSKEFSDAVEADLDYSMSASFSGAFPIATDNWNVRVIVEDIDPNPAPNEAVDDFTMNENLISIRSSSFNGSQPGFTAVTTSLKYSRSLSWSHQLYCSANYYSQMCDKYCMPTDSIEGHYSCSSSGDKVCLSGYWDPATNCKNTDCTGSTLCQHNSTCNALIDGYTCECTSDYIGRHCETPKNPCKVLSPCLNGNCSSPDDGTYTCTCSSGWTGVNCDADIDECAGTGTTSCSSVGTASCINFIGSFNCTCRNGWSGERCQSISDYCLALSPCLHGTCSKGNSSSNYTCSCEAGWTGTNCDRDVDECAAVGTGGFGACHLAGSTACVNSNGSFACLCRLGWAGPLCNNISDYCLAMKPSCNHGTCSSSGGSNYTCICDSGWQGASCNADIDECSVPGYCQNSISCQNTNGSYVCTCVPGFEGPRCDTRKNPCLTDRPCAHGNCTPVADSTGPTSDYRCTCGTGWEGRNCTADRNECLASSGPCAFGQACVNLEGSYRCDATAASYWFIFLIIVIIVLLAAVAIIIWRVLACRQGKRSLYETASSTNEVNRRIGNVKWPMDDRRTLEDYKRDRDYAYDNGSKSPALPPRRQQPVGDAEYNRVQASTALAGELELEDTYAEVRNSRMLGSGEAPEPLNANRPKPPVPDAPRPNQQQPPSPISARSAASRQDGSYDNDGYLQNNPPSRPVSNPGYLIMTANPEGYMRPISVANNLDLTPPPQPQQLPPKPPKVKRTKPKRAPAPPAEAPTLNYQGASDEVDTAAPVNVPKIRVTEATMAGDVQVEPPVGTLLGRLNSGDATAEL